MVLHLCELMEVPLRERNTLLVAAGYAPTFSEKALEDAPLGAVRKAMEVILAGHEPYPALVIDRYWTAVAFNKAVPPLLRGVAPDLLKPPVNVMRLSLHPGGLAPRIANLHQWRAHLLTRLRRQVDDTADMLLADLYREVTHYPAAGKAPRGERPEEVVIPLRLVTPEGELALFSATTVFGTPNNVVVSELAIEAFYPADSDSQQVLQRLLAPSAIA